MTKFFLFAILIAVSSCGTQSNIRIEAEVGDKTWNGTAFFVNDQGLALTAAHVVTGLLDKDRLRYIKEKKRPPIGQVSAFLWWGGVDTPIRAHVLIVDLPRDIALISVPVKQSPSVPPLCARGQIGAPVSLRGVPEFTVLRRAGVLTDFDAGGDPPKVYTTSVIRPGFSGGSGISRGIDDDPWDTCTFGVIVQREGLSHVGVVNPIVASPPIMDYLFEHAPDFMRLFKIDE